MDHTLPPRFAHLRLRDLMLLEHLHTLGSMTEAAARLHVTQSAVTQALQTLEQAFGHRLVERGRRGQRGVQLTPAGAAALQRLRVARHELLAALDAAAEPAWPALRIGALPLAMVAPVPAALARLRRRLPQVQVTLSEGTVPVLWRRLEEGELDAIVCRLPARSEAPALPQGVAHRTVGRETLVLAAAQGHPALRPRHLDPARLREHPWILQPAGSYTRMALDTLFLRAGLATPRPVITSVNFHANLRLVAEGELVCVAPRAAVRSVAGVLGLEWRNMPWGPQDGDIVLAWREACAHQPAVEALLASF